MTQVAEVKRQLNLVLAKLENQADRIRGAIAALEEIDAEELKPVAKKSQTRAAPAKRGAVSRAKPATVSNGKASEAGGEALPSTAGDFWPSLITTTPQTQGQIFEAAVSKIGTPLEKMQMKKLKDRLTFTLNRMVTKTKEIDSEGAGKTRTFFKKPDNITG